MDLVVFYISLFFDYLCCHTLKFCCFDVYIFMLACFDGPIFDTLRSDISMFRRKCVNALAVCFDVFDVSILRYLSVLIFLGCSKLDAVFWSDEVIRYFSCVGALSLRAAITPGSLSCS